jgi:hypothetical protein
MRPPGRWTIGLLLLAVAGCPPAQQVPAGETSTAGAVTPTVRCVSHGQGDLQAVFGYVNDGAPIAIPIGPTNTISGGTIVVGAQPTSFATGTQPDVFTVSFGAESSITWTLGSATVIADRSGPDCHSVN